MLVGLNSSPLAVSYSPSLQTFAQRPPNSRPRLPGSVPIVALPCTSRKSSRPFNSSSGAYSSTRLNTSLPQPDATTCARTPSHTCALSEESIAPALLASGPQPIRRPASASVALVPGLLPQVSALVHASSYYQTTLVAPYPARPASRFLQVSLSKVPRHLPCRVSPTVLAESLPINANDYSGSISHNAAVRVQQNRRAHSILVPSELILPFTNQPLELLLERT